MLTFFFNAAPNPLKVGLFLEEAGLKYRAVPIDTKKGDQHSPGFRAINPNGKVPAIDDGGVIVFDSNAILLYLAEKTGKFLNGDSLSERAELLSWLMFIASGVGPYSGQAVHFRNFAPERLAYPIKRYDYEARRHWRIVDDRLAKRRFMLGDTYTIVDMAIWGWAPRIPFMLGDENAMTQFPNLDRLMAELDARPAAQAALALKDRYAFKTEFDEEAMRHMYPQIFAPEPD
ncbi:glutathione S-transferase family protein [Oceanibium sediminis]|uniref:glutathione S-transferase family protein n=1 Tax=Oceanibium sediminis TaxID=2026339 RepID=UPI000DD3B5F3|nr:glutathione S-transferase N-terminal domain-containing protein [Oceanibium sediminis]